MKSKTANKFLEQYAYHFVLNTQNTRLLDRVHQISMHEEILEVSPSEYLLFFNDDRAMNACLKKLEMMLKEHDSSLAFF
tara:strand:+ start:840 stop:1076 length:237 start_codon:yes stop_codon:yes gene_type:complete